MRLLLDTHILLWGAAEPERLSQAALTLIESPDSDLAFSAVKSVGDRDQDGPRPR